MTEFTNVLDEQRVQDFTKLGNVLQCNQTGRSISLCSICSTAEKFISFDYLQQHHVSVHTNFDLNSSEGQRNDKLTSHESNMSFECDDRFFEYSSIAESDIKLKIEQTYDDDGDDGDTIAITEELSYLESDETKITKQIQCSCCPGESYDCIGLLKDHLFITQNLEAYPCDRCSGLFFNKTELTSHQNIHDQIVEASGSDHHKC